MPLDFDHAGAEKGLTAQILGFAQALRDQGIMVPHAAVLDALQCVDRIDLGHIQTFRDLLQCNFISAQGQIKPFRQLFDLFWLKRDEEQIPGYDDRKGDADTDPLGRTGQTDILGRNGKAPSDQRLYSFSYSPHTQDRKNDRLNITLAESEALYRSMTAFLDRFIRIKRRRYRYYHPTGRLNLRGMLRKNIRFGGEPMLLDFKRKKPGRRRIVFFCDASGSMDLHTLMAFQFIHALKRAVPQTEIFFFSTDLTRATAVFRKGSFSATVQKLPRLVTDWGGGTRIGHCFKAFNTLYGQRCLAGRPIVIVYSDGWDRGEIDLLRSQMAWIKRKAYKLLWLNPLLGTRDYRPICRGMRAALPLTDYFLPATDLYDFRKTVRIIERIIHV